MILAETAGWTREKKEREQKDQVADYRQQTKKEKKAFDEQWE